MSNSETNRRPARFDLRGATAAVLVFGAIGGGWADGPTATVTSDDEAVSKTNDKPAAAQNAPPPTAESPQPQAAPPPAPVSPPAASSPPKSDYAGPLPPEEAEAIRKEAASRLEALAAPVEGADAKADVDPTARIADKAVAEVLQDRLRRLDDYDKLLKESTELANSETDPDRRIAEAEADLADLQGRLRQPVMELLPEVFRREGELDEAARDQMRQVIEGVRTDVKDHQDKLESTSAEPEKEARAPLTALKADRDKVEQGIAALKARTDARADAPTPRTAADRSMYEERGVNLKIEAAVEALRLQIVERKITRMEKGAEAARLDRQRWIARVRLGRQLLEPMQALSRKLAENDERKLQRKAQDEQAKAQRSIDPVERYQAERLAELLALEATVVKREEAVTASVHPTLEDMKSQTARAAADFDRIKRLMEGGERGRGRLDVLSINSDYRRLGPERRKIEREERALVEERLHDYMNVLTSVELSQIEDRLLDQIDLDDLMDRLPAPDHPRAVAIWKELEDRHSVLLTRHRKALEKLVVSEQDTLDSIDRRLAILDETSSFIRTHLFWVRDQDPIGLTTAQNALVELRHLGRVSVGLTKSADSTTWKRPTSEFLAAAFFVAVIPLGILRIRHVLGRRLNEMLPPPPAPTVAEVVDFAPPPSVELRND